LLDHIRQVQKRAYEELKIASTPTFFVNGEKVEGAMPFEDFEKIILKHLSES
jgi:protein-disulfide isomerase